jgi:hypothetical protein
MTNSGFGGMWPLPARGDDRAPQTPSAAGRRDKFARKHPEISITTRREGGRLLFEVNEPGSAAVAYEDANAMMNDLEARYP